MNQHLNKYPNTYEVEIPTRLWYHNMQKHLPTKVSKCQRCHRIYAKNGTRNKNWREKNEQDAKEDAKNWGRNKKMNKMLLDQVCGFWVPLISACKHLWAHSTCKLLKNLVRDNSFFWEGGITLHTKQEKNSETWTNHYKYKISNWNT